jgi:nucleoside-diphosphate-sugar epimerase
MAERRCLIVGGSGYIGARLAEALSAQYNVVVTRRGASPVRDAWARRAGIEVIGFDSARDAAISVSGDFDAVINLAMPGAAEAGRDVEASTKAVASVSAALQLLQSGRCGRLIHFSSFHVYGGAGRQHYSEDDVPAPAHPYGQIHLECERLMLAQTGTLVVRPSNMVAAPAHADLGDQSRLLFLDLCRQAAAGALRLHNDGLSYRDFLPFDDVLAAVHCLLAAPLAGTRLFNIARGQSQRLDEVARLIQAAVAAPIDLAFGDGQDAFRLPFTISIDRMAALGWQPSASLSDETRRIIAFFS